MADPDQTNPEPLPLTAALAYAARGWRVVTILPGTKHPGIEEWQNIATTDPVKIRRRWETRQTHGVGIVTGVESGIFVVDVDTSNGKRGEDTIADLEAEHGKLPHTVEGITGSGGRHIYFKMPDGLVVTNAHASLLGPHVDIRGEGGQVLAPPTIHPTTGQAYTWEESCHPARTQVADPPTWMVELFSAPPPQRVRKQAQATGTRPGDLWAAETDWADLLTPCGATFVGSRIERDSGLPYELWARPDANHTSATVGYKGSDVLKVFTDNWKVVDSETGETAYLEAEQTYTKLGYLAATRFGGDFHKAASWIASQGYKTDPDLAGMIAPATEGEEDDSGEYVWPDPKPILRRQDLPPFPVDALPVEVAAHCYAVATQIQIPVDLCAQQAIAVLASVLAGRRRVQPWSGYSEPLNIYVVTALASGAGKSPADRWIAGPLRELEMELITQAQPEHRKAVLLHERAEAQHKTLHTKWTAGGSVTDQEMFDAGTALAAAVVGPLPRLLADDATPEALTVVLAAQGGRIAIVSTEAALLDMVCGTYADRGKTPNLDVYLKGWEAGPLIVDRKGSEPINVPAAHLTVGITVQPSALEAVKGQRVLGERGFFPRFMFSIPADIRGWRDVKQMRSGAADKTLPAWRDLITKVADWAACDTKPIGFSMPAQDRFEAWLADVELRRRPGGDLRDMVPWSSKMTGSVVRLAGIIHAAEQCSSYTEVTVETLERAIQVGDYWTAHAHAVDALAAVDPLEVQAKTIGDALIKLGQATITTRDLYRSVQRRFGSAREMIDPLEMLVETGWVRFADGSNSGDIGRRGVTTAVTTRPNFQHEWLKSIEVIRVVSHVTVSPLRDLDLDSPTPTSKSPSTSECGDNGDNRPDVISAEVIHRPEADTLNELFDDTDGPAA